MTLERVAQEIVDLHVEFERWFHGLSSSLDRVELSLAPDFLFVAPNGAVAPRSGVLDGLREAGGQQDFAIRIEHIEERWRRGGLVCATYEEWHEHATYATSRQSSVVLEEDPSAPGGFLWLSVHETWLIGPPSAG